MKQYKTGYVAITGKPNVGKSTLINAVVKRKVAITSYKPQTTRNKIKALYNDTNSSIMFIDTPGYHKSMNKLDDHLNSEIKSSYKSVDCILLLIDPTRELDDEDYSVIKMISNYNINNVILVITKKDISKKNIDSYIENVKSKINIANEIHISSNMQETVSELLTLIKTKLPSSTKPLENIEDDDNFVISELIREQIIFNTKKEIPYSTLVYVENKKYENDIFEISAVIVVEKESQKPIIIGAGGQMIKKIGTLARKELLNIYACRINLKLFVKVEKDWRKNEKFLSISN
ncbi:MAG: GTPase Era [Mycoplasmoidaceae bacterium]|nr:MAG: GTPase Era [Mycoplasmoidaceae bacterium]